MSRKFTILHTEASDGWGGQEIRILSESGWLRARGHEVIIVAGNKSRLLEKASSEGFPAFGLEFTKRSFPGDLLRLIGIISRARPDVVATHSSLDSWVGLLAARICGFPRTIRYRHFGFPVRSSGLTRFQYRTLSDHVITTADFITGSLQKKFNLPDAGISTVTTGVACPENLVSRKEAHEALCGELGVPRGSRFIGVVSVLRRGKGHELLMEALERLSCSGPGRAPRSGLHLVFVGDGPIRKQLEAKRLETACADRIHLTGHRADPWPYFRAFDIAALPSTKAEGTPQSLLQAMLAGSPVIGSNIGGVPEIVAHRETGLLVSPGDLPELTGAIERLLDCEADAIAQAAKAKKMVEEKYSVEKMGCKVLDILEGLVRKTA